LELQLSLGSPAVNLIAAQSQILSTPTLYGEDLSASSRPLSVSHSAISGHFVTRLFTAHIALFVAPFFSWKDE